MKQCPQCNQTFTDDNSFCQMDGTILILANQTDETVAFSTVDNNAPTQFISTPNPVTSMPAKSGIPGWVFLVMGIMGTALVALVAFIFLMPKAENALNASASKNNQPEITKSAKEEPKEEIKIDNKPEFKTPVPTQSADNVSTPTQPNFSSPAGNWTGDWSSKNTTYTATIFLEETDGVIAGKIDWNLTKTSNSKKSNKIGSSATEYVKGTYNYQTGKLFLRGYSKDDPSDIIILDKYNLSMSKDNTQLSGKSINGNFILRR